MCGICGFWDKKGRDVTKNLLKSLIAIRHRGPDGSGIYSKNRVFYGELLEINVPPSNLSFGHVLLKIVGVPQPIGNENMSLWIVHNGEVYNHVELREELKKKGHMFRTNSDSEVLLHLYEEKTFENIIGDYALAIYDRNLKDFFLLRDPIGIRPLFYCYERGVFGFCSEKKGLVGLCDKVEEVKPGYSVLFSYDGLKVEKFNPIDFDNIEETHIKEDEAVEKLDDLLEREISLLEYVSQGLTFSGGVDSSLIALYLHELNADFRLYTVGSKDSPDIAHAKRIADEFKWDIKLVYLNEAIVEETLEKVIYHIEDWDPVKVSIAVPLFIAFREMREDGYKVAFSGQGADELFGGYARYLKSKNPSGDMLTDIKSLHIRNLNRDDHVSMANSIEVRYPFLSVDIVKFSFSLPLHLKISGGSRKVILRRLLKKKGVPWYVWSREKKAIQYGTGAMKFIRKLSKRRGLKVSEYLLNIYLDVFYDSM